MNITVSSGARSQGYWKNHAWPVATVTVGGVVYTRAEAIAIMNLPTTGNAILQLWDQLVAAKLNKINGAILSTADQLALDDGDLAIIAATGGLKLKASGKILVYAVSNSAATVSITSILGRRMNADAAILEAFNTSSGL